MKVLVAAASKHGSTWGIADAIAEELARAGIDVALHDVSDVHDLGGFDAVVLGSAVYMGNWLPEARHFAERNRETLVSMPLWLFSSGPLGADDPQPPGDPERALALVQSLQPRGHRVFVGKLDKHKLGPLERLAAKAVHAPEGDFRQWHEIRAWAQAIAGLVSPLAPAR